MPSPQYLQRFEGLGRIFGETALDALQRAQFCIVGVGGVGSWAAEACARSGIGHITLIDHDDIHISNTNRQIHTLDTSIERSKVEVLRERILAINPECDCVAVDDLVTRGNIDKFNFARFDYVIDAIDSITFKAEMIYYCKRNKIPIITTGGAGGLTDPTMVQVKDLSRTINDPLAAKVRSRLRSEHRFTRTAKRNFGIECVYSTQLPLYPKADGSVSHEKPGIHGISLDCSMGYGSASFVTATFGNVAVARLITKILKKRLV